MAQITTEQALQIPQQLQRQGSDNGSSANPNSAHSSGKKLLTDDAVTLLRLTANNNIKKLKVEEFKGELGQDKAFVKETLHNKLSEYRLNPNTKISVSKDIFGKIELKGSLLQTDIERITEDLNKHSAFIDSFNKLSKQEPTLKYVDNVVKISSAYGVGNNLFNSLLSEETEFNKLNDIAHRYEALKSNKPQEASLDFDDVQSSEFKFVLNA